MKVPVALAEALREARVKAGLNQADLATKIGCSTGHISNIERCDARGASHRCLSIFAAAVKLPPADREKWGLSPAPKSPEISTLHVETYSIPYGTKDRSMEGLLMFAMSESMHLLPSIEGLATAYDAVQWTFFDLNVVENEIMSFHNSIVAGQTTVQIRSSLDTAYRKAIAKVRRSKHTSRLVLFEETKDRNTEKWVLALHRIAAAYQEWAYQGSIPYRDQLQLIDIGIYYCECASELIQREEKSVSAPLAFVDDEPEDFLYSNGDPRLYLAVKVAVKETLATLQLMRLHVTTSSSDLASQEPADISNQAVNALHFHSELSHGESVTMSGEVLARLSPFSDYAGIRHLEALITYSSGRYMRHRGVLLEDIALIQGSIRMLSSAIEHRVAVIKCGVAAHSPKPTISPYLAAVDHRKELADIFRSLGLAFLSFASLLSKSKISLDLERLSDVRKESLYCYKASGRLFDGYEVRNARRYASLEQGICDSARADVERALDCKRWSTNYPASFSDALEMSRVG